MFRSNRFRPLRSLALALPFAIALGFAHFDVAAPRIGPGWFIPAARRRPGKHIVLVSGDEEYRSEEALPQLGKILSQQHGFRCTVLFAIDPETGEINLTAATTSPAWQPGNRRPDDHPDPLPNLPDEQMQHIDTYLKSGGRSWGWTSTHAFNTKNPAWAHYSNGYSGDKAEWRAASADWCWEKWISHHVAQKPGHGASRGASAEQHPILRGIALGDIWGDTDVYGVRLPLPGDSRPGAGPGSGRHEVRLAAGRGSENDPMMPVAWIKTYQLPGGEQGKVFNTTMGSASDLVAIGTRRMLVNAVYWCLGLEDKIPASGTQVDLVGAFEPTPYGFNSFQKGLTPRDHDWKP